ncbi:TlpA family protein disulfide reductase [Streptomyces sp. NPDC021020]|uniref:TlpA family protein disulfide reductase n=1 Tax=Streptomyces sp. NPDC021020 TaxID=3365109 RepID=UPI00379D2446
MAVLSAAVVVLAVIVLLNLAVTAAVIRRLRRQPAATAAGGAVTLPDPGGPARGEPIPDFAAATVDGREVTRAGLAGRTVIGFFSTSCSSCAREAPVFADAAATLAADGVGALAVVQRKRGDDATELAQVLAPTGAVVLEGAPGPLLRAFRVNVTPFYVLSGATGATEGSGEDLAAALASTHDHPHQLRHPLAHGHDHDHGHGHGHATDGAPARAGRG